MTDSMLSRPSVVVETQIGIGKMLEYTGKFISRLFCIYKGYKYIFWPSLWSTCYTKIIYS